MLMTYVLLRPVLCAKFGLENDVEYNRIKSLCMVFKCPDIYERKQACICQNILV